MSLLIKALNKAEEAQAEKTKIEQAQAESVKIEQAAIVKSEQAKLKSEADKSLKLPPIVKNLDVELSLSPTQSELSERVAKPVIKQQPLQPAQNQQTSSQNVAAKSAANVFTAKGIEAKNDSSRLALIAGAGLIALLGMGLYFYQFVDNSPPVVIPPRPLDEIAAAPEVAPEIQTDQAVVPEPIASEVAATEVSKPVAVARSITEAFEPEQHVKLATNTPTKKAMPVDDEISLVPVGDELKNGDAESNDSEENTEEASAEKLTASFSANKTNKKTRKSKNNAVIASNSASIQVSKSVTEPSVSPILMSAYEAYNAGNDKDAIKLYKQVLQRDVRNVDALLGLGAIASRQGRSADANGWYGKVLEVDPRNNIAKTAMLDSQSQGNEQTNETSLKTMLAKQPDDANLHVALGNLYAEQNQWPAAQQAYFDAYSLNKTADNAYNLAVSLDQMGKPKLALPYYQRALEQASDASNIDKAALQARIDVIQ
jgi:tetratricopeptide (TPR) repeat protein